MKYDVMVVGSGIAGMESSIKLGDMGYQVLLVEKEASVGGRMILLSKVFPTLDCASCISGPKMSSTINHPNITTMTYSEVMGIQRQPDGTFRATVKEKSPFVDWTACTGCSDCQMACTVAVPDQFNADLVPRHAAYIAFPQAVPKKAVIERAGTSPCIDSCPAGIKAHGYVSLIRSGKYEEAFQLVLDATPLVGTLGRACYAPCESECTRASIEGTIPIRRLKRFAADTHYREQDGPGVEVAQPNGRRVAVVGTGPAGLTAAWQLARLGYQVRMFEAAAQPGGFLRHAIPQYRLPHDVVDHDIANLTSIGVEIVTGHVVHDLEALRAEGYDAVLVATGTPRPMALGVPGEDADGVHTGLRFLRQVSVGELPDLNGRTVAVVGGGNVAMDAARTARRLGSREVRVLYRRGREEMPAHPVEVDEAEAGGRGARLPRGTRRSRHGQRRCCAPACAASACASVRPTRRDAVAPSPSPGASSSWPARSSSRPSAWSPTTNPTSASRATREGTASRWTRSRCRATTPTCSPPATSSPARPTSPARSGRAPRGVHDRPVGARPAARRLPALRRPARRRRARGRPGPSAGLRPARTRPRSGGPLASADRLRRARAADVRGRGAVGCGRLPRLRRVLASARSA